MAVRYETSTRKAPSARPGGEPHPFSIEPLMVAVGAATAWEAAVQLGVTRRTISRLRSRRLTVAQADFYAVRAGLHPAMVWPDWWTF